MEGSSLALSRLTAMLTQFPRRETGVTIKIEKKSPFGEFSAFLHSVVAVDRPIAEPSVLALSFALCVRRVRRSTAADCSAFFFLAADFDHVP